MKIAFVIPWYGDIPGGAENECKRTVENLARGVLTLRCSLRASRNSGAIGTRITTKDGG